MPDAWEEWKRQRLGRNAADLSAYEKIIDVPDEGAHVEFHTHGDRIPCMWCGELFLPDLVDEHEEACG